MKIFFSFIYFILANQHKSKSARHIFSLVYFSKNLDQSVQPMRKMIKVHDTFSHWLCLSPLLLFPVSILSSASRILDWPPSPHRLATRWSAKIHDWSVASRLGVHGHARARNISIRTESEGLTLVE
jgi:hypothetical protein